jgi:hypothetical protein
VTGLTGRSSRRLASSVANDEVHTPPVTSALERRHHPNVNDCQHLVFEQKPFSKGQDIRVVVGPAEARGLFIPAQGTSHAANTIGNDGFAVP